MDVRDVYDDVKELTDIDHYDAEQAYGAEIPDGLVEPFSQRSTPQQRLSGLKPAVWNEMTDGSLYCAVAAAIFNDKAFLNSDVSCVLQTLSRHGIHCIDVDQKPVTETVLRQRSHMEDRQTAHLAMIDCLMMAFMKQVLSVERIVAAVKCHTSVSYKEVPMDLQDGLLFWINKICATLRDKVERREVDPGNLDASTIPEMEDLYEEICDFCCLATVISFYHSSAISLKDICFNEPMSMSDSIHNIRLVEKFCASRLPVNCFHGSYEDFLYMHEIMKQNIEAFLTDLFFYLEVSASPSAVSSSNVIVNRTQKHSIPDLRQHSADVGRNVTSYSNKGLPHHKTTAIVGNVNSPSVLSSMINSTDSLATQRTVDSLRYTSQRHNTVGGTSGNMWTPNGQGSPNTKNSDIYTLRKSPTTSFAEMGSFAYQPPNGAAFTDGSQGPSVYPTSAAKLGNQPVTYASPRNVLNNETGSNSLAPIRLQLEEKRQLYERKRQLLEAELALQRQAANQQVFLAALGKASTSAFPQQGTPVLSKGVCAEPVHHPTVTSSPFVEELSKLQQEIQRLGLEQSRIQRLLDNGQLMSTSFCFGDNTSAEFGTPHRFQSPNFSNNMQTQASAGVNSYLDDSGESLIRFSNSPATGFMLHMEDLNNSMQNLKNGRDIHPGSEDPALNLGHQLDDYGRTYKVLKQRPHSSAVPSAAQPNFARQLNIDTSAAASNGYSVQQQKQQHSSSSNKEADYHVKPVHASGFADAHEDRGGGMISDAEMLGTSSLPSPTRIVSDQLKQNGNPGFDFVTTDPNKAFRDQEIEKRKEQVIQAAIRRREELEQKRKCAEERDAQRKAEQQKKAEEAEQKKLMKELHRQKVMEDYQKRKAEQDALEHSAASNPPPMRPRPLATRGQSQPARARPQSQVLRSSQSRENNSIAAGSVDNLDQADSGSHGSAESSDLGNTNLKLFVKPSQKSNRPIVYNALQYSCLPGAVNDTEKRKVLEELAKSDSKHFLVLFRDQKCQFRGLYCWDQVSDTAQKLYGMGPKLIPESNMTMMFKYDSGGKIFNVIPSKHLSATIDGFCLSDAFWQKKKLPFSTNR